MWRLAANFCGAAGAWLLFMTARLVWPPHEASGVREVLQVVGIAFMSAWLILGLVGSQVESCPAAVAPGRA